MDITPENDIDSGYEASCETVTETTSPTSEPSSVGSHIATMQGHNVKLRFSSQLQPQMSTKFLPHKNDIHRSISSSSPELILEPLERVRSQGETSPAASSSSPTTTTPSGQPTHLPYPAMRTGLTAREVAERAQDVALMRIGSQKTPAQLLQKFEWAAVSENDRVLQTTSSCYECQLNKIQCSHIPAEMIPTPSVSTHQALQDAVGLPALHFNTSDESKEQQISTHQNVNNEAAPERNRTAPPSRKRRPPVRWIEQSQEDNTRLTKEKESKGEVIDQPAAHTGVVKKKGRPVGWRKGLGLSYAEVKKLSMKEREELIDMAGLKR